MIDGDLADLLRRHAERHSVPGASIGVLRDGVSRTACYGMASVSAGEPVTPETLFSVGSLTKSMVATVIVRLAEAGRLSLDDPVVAHVPELRGSGWAQGVTLRDLLANRSGLPLRARLEFDLASRDDQGDGALARLVAEVAEDATPAATFWSYTNVGWCVLGRVIETATNAAWDDAMRRDLAERACATRASPPARSRSGGHRGTRSRRKVAVPVEPLVARAYGPAGAEAVSTVTRPSPVRHLAPRGPVTRSTA